LLLPLSAHLANAHTPARFKSHRIIVFSLSQ